MTSRKGLFVLTVLGALVMGQSGPCIPEDLLSILEAEEARQIANEEIERYDDSTRPGLVEKNEAEAITTGMIVDGAVTGGKVADGSLGSADLAAGAVTSGQIADGTIQPADVAFPIGDITAVNVASGLAGGGTSGDVTLSIANRGVTLGNIDPSGATPGYVIKFNGSGIAWAPDQTGPDGGMTVGAGDGLTLETVGIEKRLHVGQGTGISVAQDSVSVDATWADGRFVNEGQTGAITTGMVQDGAITSAKLSDGAVSTTKLADVGVTTAKLANGSVTNSKIGADAVTSDKIQDAQVMTADLANGAATRDKLASDSVDSSKVANNSLSADDLSTGSVRTDEIADGQVMNADIADRTLMGRKIHQMGASAGHVLKWNGTDWAPAGDDAGETHWLARGADIANSNAGNVIIGDGSIDNVGAVGIGGDPTTEEKLFVTTDRYSAMYAKTNHPGGEAVVGANQGAGTSGYGVSGYSTGGRGVYGSHTGSSGVGYGVYGRTQSPGGYGVYGRNTSGTGYAMYSNGDMHVNGTLSKSAGSFKIDHPLDPANRYLSHSFVESPDMMNIYNGNVVTDAEGYATIQLEPWFEGLNRDFRYQLTAIGQFAQAIVVKEIEENSFVIRTDKPNVKVSWQVTGIRHDPYAEAHRIEVEEDKAPNERGKYQYPELYGEPPEKGLEYRR